MPSGTADSALPAAHEAATSGRFARARELCGKARSRRIVGRAGECRRGQCPLGRLPGWLALHSGRPDRAGSRCAAPPQSARSGWAFPFLCHSTGCECSFACCCILEGPAKYSAWQGHCRPPVIPTMPFIEPRSSCPVRSSVLRANTPLPGVQDLTATNGAGNGPSVARRCP